MIYMHTQMYGGKEAPLCTSAFHVLMLAENILCTSKLLTQGNKRNILAVEMQLHLPQKEQYSWKALRKRWGLRSGCNPSAALRLLLALLATRAWSIFPGDCKALKSGVGEYQ